MNATIFYEMESFEARISWSNRDEFLESLINPKAGVEPVFTEEFSQVDLQLTYRFTEDFSVFVQGVNITDEATKGYTMDPAFPTMYEFSGRRVSLGLRGNF